MQHGGFDRLHILTPSALIQLQRMIANHPVETYHCPSCGEMAGSYNLWINDEDHDVALSAKCRACSNVYMLP